MDGIFGVESAHLLSVGRVQPDAAWGIATHSHAHWEFIYFLRGCGRVELPQRSYHPQQYHLMIYPPDMPHAETADPVEPEETIFFCVDMAGEPPVGAPLLLSDQDGELRWLCERLVAEFTVWGSSPLATTYLRAFLYLVERAWRQAAVSPPDLVEIARQYLCANYALHITLRELARVARVSETHLSHRFTARMGISPKRYLLGIRLEAARRLLLTTDLRVGEIALHTGFPDPLYFSRVLKQETGLAPTEFRRRERVQENP